MAVLDTIAPEAREGVARIGAADLVAALPSCHSGELLSAVVAGLPLVPNQRVVLLYPDRAVAASQNQFAADSLLYLLPYPLSPAERYYDQSLDQGLRSLLQVGRSLGARASVMIGSDLTVATPGQLRTLAEPVLNHGYDVAVPLYARRKFGGLINSGIVYPLTRGLYGARLRFPMAVDLALSAKLADQYLAAGYAPPGWVTTTAVCAGLEVCQVHQESAPPPAGPESTDLSASLAQILGTLFLELERNAGSWQKIRGSRPVRTFGLPQPVKHEAASVEVGTMVETFQRGCRDLLDIWAVVLSPATLVELRKIARLPVDRFRLGDQLWVHVICDFILGHRQRVASREHLLGALTPIYLGWVASYALEVQDATPGAVEDRVEKLCVNFEALKPYLLSRWRWPDRFNP